MNDYFRRYPSYLKTTQNDAWQEMSLVENVVMYSTLIGVTANVFMKIQYQIISLLITGFNKINNNRHEYDPNEMFHVVGLMIYWSGLQKKHNTFCKLQFIINRKRELMSLQLNESISNLLIFIKKSVESCAWRLKSNKLIALIPVFHNFLSINVYT